MAASPVAQPHRPLIKAKWVFPFLPWITLPITALKHPAYWSPLEGRILHVVGCVAYTVALLAVVQPCRRDDERAAA